MKSVRLIPVVIFAALALLVFKGIGLITNGGYVLTGPTPVLAAGTAPAKETASSGDPTIADTAPTLQDSTPVLGASSGEGGGHGGAPAAEGGHAAPAEGGDHASDASGASDGASHDTSSDAGHGAPAADGGHGGESAGAASEAGVPCLNPDAMNATAGEGGDKAKASTALVMNDPACATSSYPTDAHGDAVPMQADNSGKVVPLADADGENAKSALTQRLAERRAELDQREADLQTREALLAAAEKKLDERTQQLAVMQQQIDTLVAQKQAADDEGFKAIVAMYEQMKPKQAAAIFDTLAPDVLLRVARAMNPRKMAPILAVMSPAPAESLTTALATAQPELTVPDGTTSENLAALPQIQGQ